MDRNRLLTGFQRQVGKFSYVWILEFQKRGAPHLHILVSIEVIENEREQLAGMWSRIAESNDLAYTSLRTRKVLMTRQAVKEVHTHPKAWESLRKTDGAKRYIAKYAFKTYQKAVPGEYSDVGRFWGSSRDVKPIAERSIDVGSDEEAREYLAKFMNRPDLAGWDVLPRYTIGHPRS